MAQQYFHSISHQVVILEKVDEKRLHPSDGTPTCVLKMADGRSEECSSEAFFNFYVPLDRIPWFQKGKADQVVEATLAEKAAPWPPSQLRDRRLGGEEDLVVGGEDVLPEIAVG